MTYATKQLTQALQELTSRRQQVANHPLRTLPQVITDGQLQFSKEVESFIEKKHDYAQRTRTVSVGTY